MSEGVEGLDGWQPVEEHLEDVVTPAVAAALHGLLDAPGRPPGPGDALPALWHWLAFLPRVAQSQLGPDGHPRKGGFLPPVSLPRRMFVGGDLRILDPAAVLVGAPLARSGKVESVEAKSGRSGSLLFVTVGYQVAREHGDRRVHGLDETQRLVYRPAAAPAANPPAAATPAPRSPAGNAGPGADDPAWTMAIDLAVDPTMLFRFSALTYNAHRIHYDRDWATREEGYPGLVVHGPLQAVGLAELCRRAVPERPITTFGFRALQPAFDDGPVALRGRFDAAGGVELVAFDHHGQPTMTATAQLAPE